MVKFNRNTYGQPGRKTTGEEAKINRVISGTKAGLTYASANEAVATVSSNGTVTAVAQGTTYVTVKSNTGAAKMVKIVVPENDIHSQVNLALNVYKSGGYQGAQTVKVTKDGQYTLVWDMATDKPNDSFALKNLTSVYIADVSQTAMAVETAEIRYDEIKADDTVLTLQSHGGDYAWTVGEFKNAINASGMFNTDDPINGWNGSAVKEVATSNHEVSFSTVSNPQKISVTFTIRNLKFRDVNTIKKKEAVAIESITENKIALADTGASKNIEVQLTPADTDSLVSFYSTNPAVVSVNSTAKKADSEGKVVIPITAIGKGTATVAEITENGLKVLYSVGVGENVTLSEPEDLLSFTDGTTPSSDPSDSGSELATPSPSPAQASSSDSSGSDSEPASEPATPSPSPTRKPSSGSSGFYSGFAYVPATPSPSPTQTPTESPSVSPASGTGTGADIPEVTATPTPAPEATDVTTAPAETLKPSREPEEVLQIHEEPESTDAAEEPEPVIVLADKEGVYHKTDSEGNYTVADHVIVNTIVTDPVSGKTEKARVITDETGHAVTNAVIESDQGRRFAIGEGNKYYATKSGKLATKKWVTAGKKKYYCSKSGKITKTKKVK